MPAWTKLKYRSPELRSLAGRRGEREPRKHRYQVIPKHLAEWLVVLIVIGTSRPAPGLEAPEGAQERRPLCSLLSGGGQRVLVEQPEEHVQQKVGIETAGVSPTGWQTPPPSL